MIAQMWDSDVRSALHVRLRKTHKRELESTRFVDELAIAGEVRIDTAVLNGAFAGYEIKSARDNLFRLPRQAEVYSKVLDYATLVVADRHANHAVEIVPSWWGVIVASGPAPAVKLTRIRQARKNSQVDPWYLCTLLWREEALKILTETGNDAGVRSKSVPLIWDRLISVTDVEDLRRMVRETLKSRPRWRAE